LKIPFNMEQIKNKGSVSLKSLTLPFFIILGGIIGDYISTIIGLNIGLVEANPQFNPMWALIIYWGAITILYLTCHHKKLWTVCANTIASTSYLGFINNILLILRVFLGI